MDSVKLQCLIEGEDIVFPVTAERDWVVGELKEAIQSKRALTLKDVDAHTLELWKININLKPHTKDSLSHLRVKEIDDAEELTWTFIKEYWPDQPPILYLQIIVKKPATGFSRITSPLPHLPADIVERGDTVSAIYKKLDHYPFIQVRGTPASGKSTLAKLLGWYIKAQEPAVNVMWIGTWPLDDVGGWDVYLKARGWIPGQKTVFIFDEAQLSYRDGRLWSELFKCIHQYSEIRAIAFASYGSPSSVIIMQGTPISVQPAARISLFPIAHEDGLPAAGLLFTPAEFNDLVSKKYLGPGYYFDYDFLQNVFKFTQGHAGAIHSFLAIILATDQYRELKHTQQRYTCDLFDKQVDLAWFLRQFEGSVFSRGVPLDHELRRPAVARVFESVLRTNAVRDTNFTTVDDREALDLCYCRGWLHTDYIDGTTQYFFPSSLHHWYIEWKMWGLFDRTTFHADNIVEFVICVISSFSPRMLSTTRRVNSAGLTQRPPEAQFQDEFYRCCHIHSNGSLIAFPEFGSAKGRVDFYIPAKKWGVELLRDGDRLQKHSHRFSQSGSYGTTLSLTDYAILDFRTTQPRVCHPNLQKLYHVVFDDKFSQVKILNNNLQVVREELRLLNDK